MSRFALSIVGLALIAGCQGRDFQTSAPLSSIASRDSVTHSRDENYCTGDSGATNRKGGKLNVPNFDGNYAGEFRYAPSTGEGIVTIGVCPGSDNMYNIPVPPDYIPDWFAMFRFDFATVFDDAKLYGHLQSQTWVPRTAYYLYVYDENGNLIESYKVGPLKREDMKLKIASPFENGLQIAGPYSTIYLEIAHPSQ